MEERPGGAGETAVSRVGSDSGRNFAPPCAYAEPAHRCFISRRAACFLAFSAARLVGVPSASGTLTPPLLEACQKKGPGAPGSQPGDYLDRLLAQSGLLDSVPIARTYPGKGPLPKHLIQTPQHPTMGLAGNRRHGAASDLGMAKYEPAAPNRAHRRF